jgi:hypothetical protein
MKRNLGREVSFSLENDIIPESLNFTIEPKEPIDWTKVWYNSYYNSFDFFSNKFPTGWQSIAGFDKVIEQMAENATSPLDEMIDRQLEADKANAEWKELKEFDYIFNKINI